MEKIINDYLTPDINQIRHSIAGIEDSYNNSWDIYAELIQNAVDAIRQSAIEIGNIDLDIDCPNHSITISDNGIGIKSDDLPYLLKPFSTNKSNIDVAIGEKGVGLKFVIFSSKYFLIRTGNTEETSEAEINNAKIWKKSADIKILPLIFRKIDQPFLGTLVKVIGIENDEIFNLSFNQLKYLLRTKTAIGNTKSIWGTDKDIQIKIKYRDINSISFEDTIPFKYYLPTENIPDNSKIDLDVFVDWKNQVASDRTDQEKMSKLKDKVIYKKGEFKHTNNRIIKYFACFVPQRKNWDDLSLKIGLATEENLLDVAWLSNYYFCKLNKGIYLSVKGMPTGIMIDHPATGFAGYWENFFMLFEDPFIKFDIGRKSVHGRLANIHRDYAKKVFNEFLQYVTKYVSGDIVSEPIEWDKDEIFSDIESMVDLNATGIKFNKIPSDQEASLTAIFYECIGNGKIQNITPLVSGLRKKYDLYALWDRKKIIIEFKSHLANLARDFNDARKMFDEMDCVVCWEITDHDKQAMKELGVNVVEISESLFAKGRKTIPHSTHIMNISGFTSPVYIIDLQKVLFP